MSEPDKYPDPALCEQCGIPACRGECDAGQLEIGLSTVKTHVKLLMRKLGAENRWQALCLARAAGELW